MDKIHAEMMTRMEVSVASAVENLDNKIGTLSEKVSELKEYQFKTQGKSMGAGTLAAWAISAVTVIISFILVVNVLTGN